MVGGCLSRLSCFFAYGVGLLLVVRIQDVEASPGERVIHKKVGDTVEFSSNLPTELVTTATWKYGSTMVADLGRGVIKQQLFQSRLEFNPTNFSLTLRDLTVGDSGDFSFISEANDQQRPTVTITLQVHEPITEDPVIDSKTTYQALNESCAVVLKCSSATHSNATYNWVVGSHIYSGSGLQRTIRPQDGGTTFTCTASNFVSEKSASKTVTCSSKDTEEGKFDFVVILSVGGACVVTIIVLTCVVVGVCCKKKHEDSDSNNLTVYADISDVAVESRTPSTLKPCSLYETIENCTGSAAPAPQTVYDKVQLNRLRKASVSPYQEVS
ncbi:SLAM family member 5-like isoform X2 [Leuresthes tenuis]|uniref:SLAM family member 5-like isoform X2 n=1 Tax=Leuresthes tenuis TaxID=355514 RepID=UPI003B509525